MVARARQDDYLHTVFQIANYSGVALVGASANARAAESIEAIEICC